MPHCQHAISFFIFIQIISCHFIFSPLPLQLYAIIIHYYIILHLLIIIYFIIMPAADAMIFSLFDMLRYDDAITPPPIFSITPFSRDISSPFTLSSTTSEYTP